MAGQGPAPKPPEQRRRRNVPQGGEWVDLPDEPYVGPRPEAPVGIGSSALAEWESWWSSPMAHMWLEADFQALSDLICLIDASHREDIGQTALMELMREIRLQRDLFGLTPKGRRQLRWRIVETAGGEKSPVRKPRRDRRESSLEVIQGGG